MVLVNKLNYIKKNVNETVREFHTRFQKMSQQLPRTYHLGPQNLLSWIPAPHFSLYQGILKIIRILSQ
jgi:hypothetical protein